MATSILFSVYCLATSAFIPQPAHTNIEHRNCCLLLLSTDIFGILFTNTTGIAQPIKFIPHVRAVDVAWQDPYLREDRDKDLCVLIILFFKWNTISVLFVLLPYGFHQSNIFLFRIENSVRMMIIMIEIRFSFLMQLGFICFVSVLDVHKIRACQRQIVLQGF